MAGAWSTPQTARRCVHRRRTPRVWCLPSVPQASAWPHHVSGQAVGELAVEDDGLAVDDGRLHAFAPRLEAAHAAGQVVYELLLPRADQLGIEDHDVGPPAWLQRAAVGETEQRGRQFGDLVDALFERPHLALVHPAPEEVRAPVAPVVTGEVGTAVRYTHD